MCYFQFIPRPSDVVAIMILSCLSLQWDYWKVGHSVGREDLDEQNREGTIWRVIKIRNIDIVKITGHSTQAKFLSRLNIQKESNVWSVKYNVKLPIWGGGGGLLR